MEDVNGIPLLIHVFVIPVTDISVINTIYDWFDLYIE